MELDKQKLPVHTTGLLWSVPSRAHRRRPVNRIRMVNAEFAVTDQPQLRVVLMTIMSRLALPPNVDMFHKSAGSYHLDRSFSTWK